MSERELELRRRRRPGRNDTAQIVIKDAEGNTVLNATGALSKGNPQALQERP
ncbi:MAG: hypothetical protein ICV69_08555 [Thermoleophilaceae bacterium]|nr:hypothetical protein [Thermoleophilaceae bacterium]